jgi:hypothetical protein
MSIMNLFSVQILKIIEFIQQIRKLKDTLTEIKRK